MKVKVNITHTVVRTCVRIRRAGLQLSANESWHQFIYPTEIKGLVGLRRLERPGVKPGISGSRSPAF
jgi:hypothetical protein